MQTGRNSSILQAEAREGQKSQSAISGREATHRIPSNHRQAERKLIVLVEQGFFEIDNSGRIWRLQKRMGCRWHGTKVIKVSRRRAEHKTPAGYLQIRAMLDGKRVQGLAHRLVWQHFRGIIPDGMVINHKNGVKDDNRPSNLEIVTYSENMRHAHKNRLLDQRGERNPAAKLSDEQVERIREMYATGKYMQKDLAIAFGVAFQTISKIVRGERRQVQDGPVDANDHRHCSANRDPETGRFISKKAAGRLLDGREWNEWPT